MKSKVFMSVVLLLGLLIFSNTSIEASSTQLIIINKKTNELAFYEGGRHVKTFSVATGRSSQLTPEGEFKIANKIVNRPFYSGNIPGGHPSNPLGNRWMGLNYGNGAYGIHGNNNPDSIGTYASAGCVRMHNDEIEWLFEQVKLHTPVIITNSNLSFAEIAIQNGYIVEDHAVITNVTINPRSSQEAKKPVTITAEATSRSAMEYKMLVHDGKRWSMVEDFSNRKEVKWIPEKAGEYTVRVIVKVRGSRFVSDIRDTRYKVSPEKELKEIKLNPSNTFKQDEPVTITAVAKNDSDKEFRFSLYDGERWHLLQGYESNSQVTWIPTDRKEYTIRVFMKPKGTSRATEMKDVLVMVSK